MHDHRSSLGSGVGFGAGGVLGRFVTPLASFTLSGLAILGLALVPVGCSGSGSDASGNGAVLGNADLELVQAGRLVDVYGLRFDASGAKTIEVYERDVIVGPDIQDERVGNSQKRDEEITYDFIGADPVSLQPRLLVTRAIGSVDFERAFGALDENVVPITAMAFGQNIAGKTFQIAPRNGAIRLVFSKDLRLPEDFFLAKDKQGRVIGVKNPEAVQLLEIVGDPTDSNPTGDFRLIPTRISYKGDEIILDPVLLGDEGNSFNVPNNARGLPESLNSTGANIRVALALEGPFRIPGLRPLGASQDLIGTNLAAREAIIRDFRSGNATDSNLWIANGFVRDSVPPRIIGELPMRLERVDGLSADVQRILVYKNGIKHEIDRGDVVKLFPVGSQGVPVAVAEVVSDPVDDRGDPDVQHVVLEVRNATSFEKYDPSNLPGYPSDLAKREAWLVENAPILVLSTEFTFADGNRDDPRYFLNFSPGPIPDPNTSRVEPNENISPFASVIVRFTKPVDLATVRPLDSLILAMEGDSTRLLDPKIGTPFLVFSQIFDEDGSQTAIRTSPPLGLYIDDEMRKPANKGKFPYYLHLVGGANGIQDLAGNAVDFQADNKSTEFVSFPFTLDTNIDQLGKPRYENNRVVNIARRFRSLDEDESDAGQQDFFGSPFVFEGKARGRPTARTTSYVDDRNQLPSPPNAPFAYCPSGRTSTLTGATPFGQPIQNPYNPLGCRLQTVWREVDLSLSRTDAKDFDLDVEQMWWGPFQSSASAPKTSFDVFDRVSLFLGHSERRPSPCVSVPASLPAYRSSGLNLPFYTNFARNLKPTTTNINTEKASEIEDRPMPHAAYIDQTMVVRQESSVFEPNGINRFLPLPTFETKNGYFTYRDERLAILGGGLSEFTILSPFKSNSWNGGTRSVPAEGRVGAIALPLIGDFWSYPDDPDLPKENPFLATGFNGSQVSLTVQSSAQPNFRVYSAGGTVGTTKHKISPSSADGSWNTARGGFTPTGGRTAPGDNVTYWMRFDFLKRISVMTYGFLRMTDPHNDAKHDYKDPRLGPYTIGANEVARFEARFEPPLSTLPAGTKIIPEYRGGDNGSGAFEPFDPLVAGEAHVRTYNSGTQWWQYTHVNRLTPYTADPNKLYDTAWLNQYKLAPSAVRLMNFRFVFQNNTQVSPAVSPNLESFALVYRIEATR